MNFCTYTGIYLNIFVCGCVCVCEREGENTHANHYFVDEEWTSWSSSCVCARVCGVKDKIFRGVNKQTHFRETKRAVSQHSIFAFTRCRFALVCAFQCAIGTRGLQPIPTLTNGVRAAWTETFAQALEVEPFYVTPTESTFCILSFILRAEQNLCNYLTCRCSSLVRPALIYPRRHSSRPQAHS